MSPRTPRSMSQLFVPSATPWRHPLRNHLALECAGHLPGIETCFPSLLYQHAPLPSPPPPHSSVQHVFLHVFNTFCTQFNKFLIARDYRHCPTHDPDSFVHLNDLSAPSSFSLSSQRDIQATHPPPWPWTNMSIWRLMNWVLTGSRRKSATEVT